MILADTHAWLWYMLDRTRLSRAAFEALDVEAHFAVAAISVWETALLIERRRINVHTEPANFFRAAFEETGITLLPLTPAIAIRAAARELDVLRDPADRLIVATALSAGTQLVTKDERIHRANVVTAIW